VAEPVGEEEVGTPPGEVGTPPGEVGTQEQPAPSFDVADEVDERLALVGIAELPIGVAVTLPQRGASPFQDRLTAANAAARASSLERLATWFPGYDFEAAAQNVDDRRFAVIGLGDGSLVDYIQGDGIVQKLLLEQMHNWGLGGISFSHGDVEGHRGPPGFAAPRTARQGPNQGFLEAGGLVRALDERWTAIINSADSFDPALAEVCLALNRAYGSPVNTNIYVSYGPSKGFGAHWDSHDTIIVPVRGAKRWTLFEPAVLSAQRPWIDQKVSEHGLWEGVIEPGMALVIPRGWGHRVDGSDDLSVHCTIGINRLEAHHLLERVSYEAGFWPALRADVPYDVRQPITSYGGSVFDEPHGFVRTISEIVTPEMTERAIAAHRARVVRRLFPSFVDTFRAVSLGDWSGLGVRLIVPAGVMVLNESEDAIVVAFDNWAVRLAADAIEAFLVLADGKTKAVVDLPAVGPGKDDQRREFARQLVVSGVGMVERLT
jgi:hypothetical protein